MQCRLQHHPPTQLDAHHAPQGQLWRQQQQHAEEQQEQEQQAQQLQCTAPLDGSTSEAATSLDQWDPVCPKLPSLKGPFKKTLAALERIRQKTAARVAVLEEQQRELRAKHVVLQLCADALRDAIVASQPLRAAAAAAAAAHSSGAPPKGVPAPPAGGFVDERKQEAVLSECLQQLQALESGGRGGAAVPSSASAAAAAVPLPSNGCSWPGTGGGGSCDGGVSGVASTADRGSGGGGGGGGGALGVSLIWARQLGGVEGAEAKLRSLLALTPRDVAARGSDYVRNAAVHLFRLSERVPNAGEVRARLVHELHRAMAENLGIVAVNPCAYAGGSALRMDTMEQLPAPPPREHWVACVKSLRLTAYQELLTSALLSSFRRAVTAVIERREMLMERQRRIAAFDGLLLGPESLGQEDELAEILNGVERCQIKFAWLSLTYSFVLYRDVFTPEQSARWTVSAYPYFPTLSVMASALEDIRKAAAAPDDASANAAPAAARPLSAWAPRAPSAAAPMP